MRLTATLTLLVVIIGCTGAGPTASLPTPSLSATGSTAATPAASPTSAATPTSVLATATPAAPTLVPTATLTLVPTATPSAVPTTSPTLEPTLPPTIPPTIAPAGNLIEVFAGGGTMSVANGVRAVDIQLLRPSAVDVASDGSVWIVDANLNQVMRITPDGTLADVASGTYGAEGITVVAQGTDPSARVYIADRGAYRIVMTDGGGGITRVAGDENKAGFHGDGGPARLALLFQPYDVASDDEGNLFIADTANQRIRWIDAASGDIDTIAGNGTAGFSGDGGPAVDAMVYSVQGLAVDPAGAYLLIADTANGRVRHLDLQTGIITTIAGTGGGSIPYNPALTGLQTPLIRLAALALDAEGNVYFEVAWGDIGITVMRLDSAGLMTIVAGGGLDLSPGGPALSFSLPDIIGLAIDPTNGALLISGADGKVYRVPDVANP